MGVPRELVWRPIDVEIHVARFQWVTELQEVHRHRRGDGRSNEPAGQQQSPVDLSQPIRYDIVDPVPSYGFVGARRELAHGVVRLTFDTGAQLEVDGAPFELVQLHGRQRQHAK